MPLLCFECGFSGEQGFTGGIPLRLSRTILQDQTPFDFSGTSLNLELFYNLWFYWGVATQKKQSLAYLCHSWVCFLFFWVTFSLFQRDLWKPKKNAFAILGSGFFGVFLSFILVISERSLKTKKKQIKTTKNSPYPTFAILGSVFFGL